MPLYNQIIFQKVDQELSSILVALLSVQGFDGFEEKDGILVACIPADLLDKQELYELAEKYYLHYEITLIEETNWNAIWESGFEPVIVDDFVAIRADFHEPVTGIEQEIIITPKMSFGTGHHATTYLVVKNMRDIDFKGRTVFDFGTGTGILAILAEKLGAGRVVAIDYDEWSIENAKENLARNQCSKTVLIKGDTAFSTQKFDIILANINRQVIIDNFLFLEQNLNVGGTLLLSGLLEEDENLIRQEASRYGLVFSGIESRNGWICMRYSH